jgi:mannose-6-phosphate isomerase
MVALRQTPLYPLRFEPLYQYRLWGGRRLRNFLAAPLPGDGPIGEAWLLSDRDDHPSKVLDGALKGATIRQLMETSPEQLMGKLAGRFDRFPLLLKFLDVQTRLSVQVHPSDAHPELIPAGDTGKTEAWVVLETGPDSRIYAGLKPNADAAALLAALAEDSVAEQLASFTPELRDTVLVPAGTVHSLRDIVVFEVQQNSDVTFRLYDWDQIDPETGQHRALQVAQSMACIDFSEGAGHAVAPLVEATRPVLRELLIHCDQFQVTRISGQAAFQVEAAGVPHALVCLAGAGSLQYAGASFPFEVGDALLLPAVVEACSCVPQGAVCLLDISVPAA